MRRTLTALAALAVTAITVPAAATSVPEPDLTLVYVYRVADPSRAPSWENSGRQSLVAVLDGHVWPVSLAVDVCGPGWGVQVDQTSGLPRVDVPLVVDRAAGVGVLGWPPIVAASHRPLTDYQDVPECADPPVDPPVDPPTDPPAPPIAPPATPAPQPVDYAG